MTNSDARKLAEELKTHYPDEVTSDIDTVTRMVLDIWKKCAERDGES